jgi:hypothetical protein
MDISSNISVSLLILIACNDSEVHPLLGGLNYHDEEYWLLDKRYSGIMQRLNTKSNFIACSSRDHSLTLMAKHNT